MNHFDPKAMETARIQLEWKQFGLQMMLDEGLFLEPEFMVQDPAERIFGGILVQMRTKILTDNLPAKTVTYHTSVTHEIPASTWQMWKLRHRNRWYARRLVARWPVQYSGHPEGRKINVTASINLERYRAFPRAPYRYGDHLGRPVLMHEIRGPFWDVE